MTEQEAFELWAQQHTFAIMLYGKAASRRAWDDLIAMIRSGKIEFGKKDERLKNER